MSRETPARARILAKAGQLFYAEGYRAVGIDRVIAEAGVAKATFYHHFPSKDALILAWIEAAEAALAARLPPETAPKPFSGYLDAVLAIAKAPECLGCTWQGAAAEFALPGHPVGEAAAAVKRRTLAALERRARAQGIAAPKAAAERAFLLIEGIWASVRVLRKAAPLAQAREAFRRLSG
jgi:AcrR family transcriptional regulator